MGAGVTRLSSFRARKGATASAGRGFLEESLARLEEEVRGLEEKLRELSDDLKAAMAHPARSQDVAEKWFDHAVRFVASLVHLTDVRRFLQAEEVDEFGLDERFEERIRPLFDFFFDTYWRVETKGVEHVPASGAALLVSNHSGTVPWDASMIKVAVRKKHPAHRDIRFLVEDFVYHFPFLGTFMYRIGGVRACPENATRLLRRDQAVLCFPEGVKGIGKLYKDRYRLQRFGRGGFVRLCMKTKAPLVPVAVVGAEEIHPIVLKMGWFARIVGLPYIPVTPTFPLLGPLGLVPLPTKWRIEFGEPMKFDAYEPAQIDDPILVNRLAEEVRRRIQSMLAETLKKRVSIW